MKNLLGNKIVESTLRVLSGGVGFIFLLMGFGFLIIPEVLAMNLFLEPSRAVGINSLRGDLGALFLGMGLFSLLGTFSTFRRLLFVPIVFLSLVITGRLISYLVDDIPVVLFGTLISELVFLTILILTIISYSINAESQKNRLVMSTFFNKKILILIGSIIFLILSAFKAERYIGNFLWTKFVGRQMKQSWITSLPDGLHVGLAGTGAPLPDTKRTGVCTFVLAGEHLFIVDTGPGSTKNLELMRVPLGNIEAVLFTHLHSDHIGALGELMLKSWTSGARKKPLKILGPKGIDTVVQGFNQAYSIDKGFRFAHHGDSVAPLEGNGGSPETIEGFDENKAVVIFQKNDLKVTAFLVDHSPADPALGFRFDYKGRSVVISGDTLPSESLRNNSQNVDLLLHEALDPEMLGVLNLEANKNNQKVLEKVSVDILSYHTFPEEAARIAQDANVGHLVFHHIIPPTPIAILHSTFLGDSKKYYKGPITFGVEGMLFSLPPNSKEILKKWFLN
ncbi:MAG: MBL fold metallo-hydrolase [Leptospiraceae bacterium]|nr:MBL fold metallo-hydrolase [Leptospiraceae bacterium]